MNPILENKLDELSKLNQYECWYLVKQPTDFGNLCYLVSFLVKYQSSERNKPLQEYIGDQIDILKKNNPNVDISNNYRALRVAAFFGLIILNTSKYEDAFATDTYNEINKRCNGKFENTELYSDIIQRQIEKMFISSEIDEQSENVRKDYRLYPVMLLYKVLIEIGRSTNDYSITTNEYRYFVATTKKFEDFLETLLLIKLLRAESDVNDKLSQFRDKFDNRLIRALKQLDTLEITNEYISLKENKVEEVSKKVFIFEENPNIFLSDNYIEFLGSTKSLFNIKCSIDSEGTSKNEIIGYIDESTRNFDGCNILLYGVPGCGKSYTIQKEYCSNEQYMERLVFHPDYMYSDFVGQILPVVKNEGQDDEKVRYEFTPGPFTKLLKVAYENPTKSYYLIIEEINRGNAPAIFGEIFQLLDRMSFDDNGYKKGTSEYGITNANIAKVVYGDENIKVRIPSNMSIIGTMNTSDQNVFTLDTAFQRRWIMRMIPNSFVNHPYADTKILDTQISWEQFCEAINSEILNKNNITSSEDKRLGAYFVSKDELNYIDTTNLQEKELIEAKHSNARFAEKVLKYLWDDAFKFSHSDTFNTRKYKSLEDIIKAFNEDKTGNERFEVFNANTKKLVLEGVNSNNEINSTFEEEQ